MADAGNTLREILQGFNSYQAQLGLSPGAMQAQGLPQMQTPAIRHPGEVSAQLVALGQQQQQALTQTVQQAQYAPPPSAMGAFPLGAPGGGGGGAAGAFAGQYQQRMAQVQQGYQDPYRAHQMAAGGAFGQMTPGLLAPPSPTLMTAPSMGVYRTGFQAPPPPIGIPRTPESLQSPFMPAPPAPMFQTPFQMQQVSRDAQMNRDFAEMAGFAPLAARGASGLAGMGIGAALGRAVGGVGGGTLGALAGGLLGFGPGGQAVQNGAQAAIAPAVERRAFGVQMQNMSRNFVVGGTDLASGGRGLTLAGGVQTANGLQRAVNQEQTSGFNMRDMMSITSMAGDTGMLDMAQNSEQIVSQAKNVARGLSAFMQLANEPDIRNAMRQMAGMRQLGMTIPETTVAMQNAQTFARQAGTTVADLSQTAGMPGAHLFQRMGMTGGLGYNVGMGAGGMARQAVASGAFTPGQLNMAGGVRGIQQQLTEGAAAGLGVNFPLMAALRRNENGQLAIDREAVDRIRSGDVSLEQQAGMAQRNVERLGGAKVITEISTRLNELRDELGKHLGPQGSLFYTMTQAMNLQKSAPGMTLGGALRAMGVDAQQARTMELTAKSPQFWQNMQRQTDRQISDARMAEERRLDTMRETSDVGAEVARMFKPVTRGARRFMRGLSGAWDDISMFSTAYGGSMEESRTGAVRMGVPESLRIRRGERKHIMDYLGSDAFSRQAAGRTRALARQDGVATAGSFGAQRTELDRRMGSAGLAVANLATLGAVDLVADSQTAADRATLFGGAKGWLARHAPNLSNAISLDGPEELRARRIQAQSLAADMRKGTAMSVKEAVEAGSDLEKQFRQTVREVSGGEAAKGADATAFEDAAVRGLIKVFRGNSVGGIDRVPPEEQQKEGVIKEAVAAGVDEAVARKMVNTPAVWKKIRPRLMRRAQKEAPEGAQASIAQALGASGSAGAAAARTARKTLSNLQTTQKGINRLMLTDSIYTSSKDLQNVADVVMQGPGGVKGDQAALMKMAMAARLSGDDDTYRAAIKDLQAQGLSKKEIDTLREKTNVRDLDEDTREGLADAGKKFMSLGGSAAVRHFRKEQAGLKATAALVTGATKVVDAGVRAFDRVRAGDDVSLGSALTDVDNDKDQLKKLKGVDKELYQAVKDYANAGKDTDLKSKALAAARKRLGALGTDGEDAVYGGRGAGGAAEASLQKEKGRLRALQRSFTGDPQGDFAKTIPTFAEASSKLLDAATRAEKTVAAAAINSKVFKGILGV